MFSGGCFFFFTDIQAHTLAAFSREVRGNLSRLSRRTTTRRRKRCRKPPLPSPSSPPVTAASAVSGRASHLLLLPNNRPPSAAAALPSPGGSPPLPGADRGEASPSGGEAREGRQKVSSTSGRQQPSTSGAGLALRRTRHRGGGQVEALPPSPHAPLPAPPEGKGPVFPPPNPVASGRRARLLTAMAPPASPG